MFEAVGRLHQLQTAQARANEGPEELVQRQSLTPKRLTWWFIDTCVMTCRVRIPMRPAGSEGLLQPVLPNRSIPGIEHVTEVEEKS